MDEWPPTSWHRCDRPIQYAIYSADRNIVVPVKVFSMAPTWNGCSRSRTITLFEHDGRNRDGVQVDYKPADIFETKKDALKEVFLRKLKGTRE